MPYPRHTKYSVASKEARTRRGILYASKTEMLRSIEWYFGLRGGEFLQVIEQPIVRLGCPENKYRPDAFILDRHHKYWYEEIKGFETAAFKRWKRLWKTYGPAPLRILTRRGNGWAVEQIEGRTDGNAT